MAFKYNPLGQLVAENPKAAFKELKRIFEEQGYNSRLVADECGVNRPTLWRWLRRLEEAGLGDPRKGNQAKQGRPSKQA